MLKNIGAVNDMLPSSLQGEYRAFVFVHVGSDGCVLHIYSGPELQNVNEKYLEDCVFIGGMHRLNPDRMTIIKSLVAVPVRETSTHAGIVLAQECISESHSRSTNFGFNEPILLEHSDKYRINIAGRNSNPEFFSQCPSFQEVDNQHCPFLLFEIESKQSEVRIIHNPQQLLQYPNYTQVMVQWPGKWSSHFFTFKIGKLLDYMCDNNIDVSALGTKNFSSGQQGCNT
jgi:hypothetical protein